MSLACRPVPVGTAAGGSPARCRHTSPLNASLDHLGWAMIVRRVTELSAVSLSDRADAARLPSMARRLHEIAAFPTLWAPSAIETATSRN